MTKKSRISRLREAVLYGEHLEDNTIQAYITLQEAALDTLERKSPNKHGLQWYRRNKALVEAKQLLSDFPGRRK